MLSESLYDKLSREHAVGFQSTILQGDVNQSSGFAGRLTLSLVVFVVRQTKHCYAKYNEFFRCSKFQGEDHAACQKIKSHFFSLCPKMWVSILAIQDTFWPMFLLHLHHAASPLDVDFLSAFFPCARKCLVELSRE